MKFLPKTVSFQPLSVEARRGRVIQGWKGEVRNKTGRVNNGKENGEINLDVVQSERFRMMCLHCLADDNWRERGWCEGGKWVRVFYFSETENNKKYLKQKQKRKHSGGFQAGDTGSFPWKMCVSVSSLIGKNVPWSLIFHCRTSIDGAKNNLWDIQSVPAFDKSQSRPQASGCNRMFINSASVTSVGARPIIGNDWEIMKTSADLPLPWWPLAGRSPGDFDSRGADAAVC